MKQSFFRLSAFALAGSSAFAAPFLAIGDNAELFLTGSVGARYDDNITLVSSNEVDDTILQFVPGLNLTFGKNSLVQGSVVIQESIDRYSDNSALDTELTSASGVVRYDDGKLKLGFSASFAQLNQNTRDVRPVAGPVPVLIRRDATSVSGSAESRITEKSAVGAGLSFAKTDYKRAGYTDSEEFSVPLNYYYAFRPKLDLSFGFRYRETTVDSAGALDSKGYFYNVGARGEFTPKLIGQFSVGLNQQDYENNNSDEGLGLNGSFSYLYSLKTTLVLGFGNDFSTSAGGQSTENSTLSLGVSSELATNWKAGVHLSYNQIDYAGPRKDDYLEGSVGISYIMNSFVSIAGSYVYRDNDSNVAEFTNNVFSIAATLRY